MDAASLLLPFASTLLGAAITYGINVRQRRLTHFEDTISSAIAAVAAAEISVDFVGSVSRPTHMSKNDFDEYQSWLVMEGMKAWATKVAQANDALAGVLPYQPDLAQLLPFRPDATHRGTHRAIISALKRAELKRSTRSLNTHQ